MAACGPGVVAVVVVAALVARRAGSAAVVPEPITGSRMLKVAVATVGR
jgi:hypothetical protein